MAKVKMPGFIDMHTHIMEDDYTPERDYYGHTVEHTMAKAQAAVDSGAGVLKIIASGAILAFGGVPGSPEMTPEEISAVVDVAHGADIPVAAHAHGAQSVKGNPLSDIRELESIDVVIKGGLVFKAP